MSATVLPQAVTSTASKIAFLTPDPIDSLDAVSKEIPPGRWASSLWELEDTRRRTLDVVAEVDSNTIGTVPPGFDNSIGALLHHIALIEADWLYADILGAEYPEWMYEAFPDEDRDVDGRLVPARRPLAVHLATMAIVRDHLLSALSDLPDSEFTRVRSTGSGDLTPQWVLHHLRQHEAEHRGQIQSLQTALRTPIA